MKKALLLFFVLAFIHAEAQIQRGIEKSDIRRGFYADFSAGTSTPTGNYKSYSQVKTNADGQVLFGATEEIAGKIQFNIDAGYQFGAFGMGLSLGTLKHEISDVSFQSDLLNLDFPLHTRGGELDGTYYGIGPEYTLPFGKFSTKASTRIGLVDFSASTFTGSYNGDDVDVPVELMQTDLGSDEKTSLAYSSVGLQLSYAISKQISLFAKTDYAFAIGDGLQVADAGIIPNDIDGDKMITAFDVQYPEEGIPFENIRTVKPRMMNVGVGLTWHFSTAQSQTKKVSVRGWDTKHKSQFNAPLSDNYSQDDELQRKLPIREGGRTVEAGNIPESQQAFDDVTWSTTLSDNTEMPPRDIDKPFLMTKDELVDVIANEAKLTKVDAGNALNALYKSLSTLLNNEESIQLIHFEENKNTSEASDERVADLKKLADELVNLVADEAKLTKADAGNALNSFLSNLDKTLKENNLVSPESNSKLIVPVALNKGLRFEIDKDLSGNGLTYTVLSVKADDKDLDSDGYADVARGIEKSDIRRGMVIAKPSPSRVAANNPNTEETTKRLATGDLKSLYPPENKKKSSSYFKKIDDIEYFVWEYIGKEIPNANYIIELTKIGDNGQAQQIFIGQIAENADKNQPNGKEINSANKKVAKFKAGKTLADVVKRTGNPNQGDEETMTDDGLYTWKVIETTTGISSEPSFFTVSKKFSDVHGYNENSAMLVVKIDQTLLRNTNTVITSENKELLDKRHDRMGIRALRIHDYRHGIRARHHDERIKTARSNDARIKTLRSNDERIKSARTNDARIKTARTNDARIKDARVSARADKRHDDALRANSNFSDQPIEIITDENFKVPPQTNIDTKYLRIKNQQSVQIDKGPLQLIAPLLSAQNNDKSVTYSWIITNKDENTTNSFNGSSIVHDFSLTGTYEIEITPALNGQKRKPYRVIFVVK